MAALATAILRGLTSHQHLDELLERGVEVADLNFRDPLGRSLIHLAAEENDVSAMRWLVQHHRADPTATTLKEGNSALHVAASEGHLEAVTYLLEDASLGVAGLNRAGETALDLAVNGGHDNVVRLMTRYLRSPLPPMPSTAAAAPAHAALGAPSSGDDEGQRAGLLESNRQSLPTEEPLPSRHDGRRCEPPRNDETDTVSCAGEKQIAAAAAATAAAASPEKRKAAGRTPPSDGRGVTRGGFYVAGAWSKAGVCSCFNVRHRHLLGKHGVVFDMGVCPSEVVPVKHVFITHGHLDHCGAIASHARLRALSNGPPAKYYMHANLAAGMDKVRRAFEEVEGDSIAMEIVAVSADDNVDLGQGCFVRPFTVKHRIEALGFALVRRRAEGLKKEYRELDRKTIGALKKRGVEVSTPHEAVEVVYTGDTVMAPLVSLPQVWSARLLIMEVTYLDGDRTAATKNHHIHVQDLLDNIEKLQRVEQLVVAHVSERHGHHRNVLKLLAATLPPALVNKVSVALGEFGAPGYLTYLEDYFLEEHEQEEEEKSHKAGNRHVDKDVERSGEASTIERLSLDSVSLKELHTVPEGKNAATTG